MDRSVFPLAAAYSRGNLQPFGIRQADRLQHLYAIGQTGAGKSTFLEAMIRRDIRNGTGCALIDPHGDLASRVLASVDPGRRASVTYIDIADPNATLGYNPLTRVSSRYRPLVASGLLSVMKKMWSDAWGVRMEHILRNTLLALLDQPHAMLPDVLHMLGDKAFRKTAIQQIENAQVREFWTNEFPATSPRYLADSIAPIQNKVGAFLADPRLRRFVCPEGAGLRLRTVMDEGGVLIVNLAKGVLGEDSADILGSLLVTSIGLAALSRGDVAEYERCPFFTYIDEFSPPIPS